MLSENQVRTYITSVIHISTHSAKTIVNASSWCHSSIYQGENDVHLADLVEILRILSRFVRTTNPVFSAHVGSDAAVCMIRFLHAYETQVGFNS